MKFAAVCLGQSRFVVNKSEKKKKDKIGNTKVPIFLLFLYENIRCGYSLEAPPGPFASARRF